MSISSQGKILRSYKAVMSLPSLSPDMENTMARDLGNFDRQAGSIFASIYSKLLGNVHSK